MRDQVHALGRVDADGAIGHAHDEVIGIEIKLGHRNLMCEDLGLVVFCGIEKRAAKDCDQPKLYPSRMRIRAKRNIEEYSKHPRSRTVTGVRQRGAKKTNGSFFGQKNGAGILRSLKAAGAGLCPLPGAILGHIPSLVSKMCTVEPLSATVASTELCQAASQKPRPSAWSACSNVAVGSS